MSADAAPISASALRSSTLREFEFRSNISSARSELRWNSVDGRSKISRARRELLTVARRSIAAIGVSIAAIGVSIAAIGVSAESGR
jgi:hypothetical protein